MRDCFVSFLVVDLAGSLSGFDFADVTIFVSDCALGIVSSFFFDGRGARLDFALTFFSTSIASMTRGIESVLGAT